MKYIVAADTDVGITKTTNQDSILIRAAKTADGPIVLAVLCDGMGGLEKGELASAEAVKMFASWFENEAPLISIRTAWEDIMLVWKNMITGLNQKLLVYGKRTGTSLGTTLSAMLIKGGEYLIAHVGDSRIYSLGGNITQLTEDQTVVAREVKRGKMTLEEARLDPRRNVLLQCVGASAIVVPEFILGTVERNTTYLLCSDGFRHEITEGEIMDMLNPETAYDKGTMLENARHLIETVKSRKERDNISVALVRTTDGEEQE